LVESIVNEKTVLVFQENYILAEETNFQIKYFSSNLSLFYGQSWFLRGSSRKNVAET
jgi:hypothetical protein